MSSALSARLELAQRRATERMAENRGIPADTLRVTLLRAYVVWRARLPWRLLPEALAACVFERTGRRFAGRFIERSGNGAS